MGEMVSQAEFARRVNVTRQRVHSLVKEGRLRLVGKKGKRKLLDFEKSVRAFESTKDPTKESKIAPGGLVEDSDDVADDGGWSFSKARRERETANARRQKLALKKEEGKLVVRKEVERDAFSIGRIMRDALLAITPRIQDALVAARTRKKVNALLSKEIDGVLAELEQIGEAYK